MYKVNTKHGRASTEKRKLDEYDSDTEEETIKHSNGSKDNEEIKRRKLEVNIWILVKHIIEWDI
jgi:hypothetical protein